MARQVVNVGISPNDGTGTPLRDAMIILNDNFLEIYTNPVINTSITVGNSSVNSVLTPNSLVFVNNATTIRIGTTSVNSIANTTGFFTGGSVNAASHTVGTSTIANSTGVYTGVVNATSVNAASHTVGTATIANSTGVYTSVVNATTMNAASYTVGTSTIANSTGVYTGVVNGSSITVGTSTIANSTGVYTGVVNASSVKISSNTINVGTFTAAANGYTFLPNGFKMNFGYVSANSSVGTATFASAYTSVCYVVTATSNTPIATYEAAVITTNTTAAGIRTANTTSANIFYMAIGV